MSRFLYNKKSNNKNKEKNNDNDISKSQRFYKFSIRRIQPGIGKPFDSFVNLRICEEKFRNVPWLEARFDDNVLSPTPLFRESDQPEIKITLDTL